MNAEIEIRRTTFEDEVELKQLVKLQNFVYAFRGLKFTTELFKKWYVDNPLGNVVSFSAFDGDKMVAHYACIPTQMLIEGKVVNGIHSMAVVTHPDYRGKGLFIALARKTYELAKELGYEFVMGVSNANSFHGFMKNFPFTFIGRLDVKWGWGPVKYTDKTFSKHWTDSTLNWRLSINDYRRRGNTLYAKYGNIPFIKTVLGYIPDILLQHISINLKPSLLRPFNLYVGIGMDLSEGIYFDMPKFIKHSPFNLRFMDLTEDKHLPEVNKDNIVFQLLDFDVI